MSKNTEFRKTGMIKTLRITSIAVGILTVSLFAFSAFFGSRGDKDIDKFIKSPGVIELFNKAKIAEAKKGNDQVSPFVRQAEAFALYLNPPPEAPKPIKTPSRPTVNVPRPPRVTAKFKLIGTSYYADRPEQSLALIDDPGKGLRWVGQSEKVGHLVFEQIKDGVVVVRDGKKTFELTADRPKKISLVKSPTPKVIPKPAPKPVLQSLIKQPDDKPAAEVVTSKPPPVTDEKTRALMEAFVSKMQAVQAKTEANEVDVEKGIGENIEMMDKFVSDFQAMRITAEESNNLGHLGKELKEIQMEPNQTKSSNTKSHSKIMERRSRERIAKERAAKKDKESSDPNSQKQKD